VLSDGDGNPRAICNSSGNWTVGTTNDDPAGSGVQGIAIRGDGVFESSKNGAYAADFGRNTNDGELVRFRRSGSLVGSISVTTILTTYNTTSDYRLKNVIGVVSDSGKRIDALEPIEYDFKTGERTRGFLAHKFAEIYPNSVNGEKDAVDEEGKPIYQSMQASTSEVMADLISEIQSLRKRVALLESK
jgi:hypothetical protein